INTFPSGSSFLVFPSFPDICNVNTPGPGCNPPGATSEFAGVTYQPHGGSPYQITYNLNVQREIFHSTILSVGYVGSVSRHLWTQGDINPPQCIGDTPGNEFPDCTGLPQIPNGYPAASDATFTVIPGSAGQCAQPSQNDNGLFPGSVGTGCYGSGAQF